MFVSQQRFVNVGVIALMGLFFISPTTETRPHAELYRNTMQVLDCSWLWGQERDCDMKLVLRTHTNHEAAAKLQAAASREIRYRDRSRAPRSGLQSLHTNTCVHSNAPPECNAAFLCGGQQINSAGVEGSHHNPFTPTSRAQYRTATRFGGESDTDSSTTSSSTELEGDSAESGAVCAFLTGPKVRMVESSHELMAQQMLVEQEHHLHAVIIASASAYFKLLMTTDVGRAESTSCTQPRDSTSIITGECLGDVFKYACVELVDPDQFLAAGSVLAFIYMHRLPRKSQRTVKHLLNMIQVSDRWMVPGCVWACHQALASINPDSITLADATAIYSLPTCLLDAEGMDPALELAEAKLLSLFGNTVEVVNSPLDLLQQWLELPYTAVLALLSSNQLTTDSEDTVIMLLSWWLEEEEGRACTSTEELAKLQDAIRYSRLSPSYLTQLVPKLPRLCIGETQLLKVLEVQSWEAKTDAPFPQQLLERLSLPEGWLQTTRPIFNQGPNPGQEIVLTMEITEAALRAKLDHAAYWKTRGPMVADFTTTVNVQGLRVTLRLGFGQPGELVCAVDMHAQLPRWDTLMDVWPGVPCEVRVGLFDSNRDVQIEACTRGIVLGRVEWFVDQLAHDHPGSPLNMSWWNPFLSGGCVRFRAAISLEPPACYHYT